MWEQFKHWLHHLFNPHCEICKIEREERTICQNCEMLKHQLAITNHHTELVLRYALSIPEAEERVDTSELKPIRTMAVPWKVRKEALEELDRQRAKSAKEKKEHAAAT